MTPTDGPARPGPATPPEMHAADPDEAAAERALAGMARAGAVSEELSGMVRTALAGADDADAFLDAAAGAGIPEDLAGDLALRRFMARVDAERR